MIYVDTNIILDVLERDPRWFDWSARALEDAREAGALVTGPIVAAEISHYLASAAELTAKLDALLIELVDADLDAAWLAGQAFRAYRKRGGARQSLLADFLIGGQAMAMGAAILTRDVRRFKFYFPDLKLITPEENND